MNTNLITNEELGKVIADQKRKLEELTSKLAYSDHYNNMLTKANESLVLKNASLSSQVTRGVDDCNEKVDEIAELKAQVELQRAAMQLVLNTNGFKCSIIGLESALNKTPAQCLQSIKANAVLDYEASLSSFPVSAKDYIDKFLKGE